MINLEQARLDPAEVFRSPEEILNSDDLTRTEKIDILERWAYEERQLMIAEEENMPIHSRDTNNLLDRILDALMKLGATH
ncbi:MAG: hypothetical protein JSS53_01595 [Proteobacteria bacterium]|nr:hypothetical protein [Pseudomonadota bacterium]